MMRILMIFLLSVILLTSCSTSINQPDLLKEVAGLDSIQRKAHYEKDAVLLGSIMADSFYVASNGRMSWSTKEKMISGFKEYFKTTTYSHWENVDSPLIDISDELAVVTYHKKTISSEGSESKQDTALFAWASVLKRINGAWKIKGIITTDNQ